MSLSRILNDDPLPTHSTRSTYTAPTPAPIETSAIPAPSQLSPSYLQSAHLSHSEHSRDITPTPQSSNSQSDIYQGASRWEARTGEWAQGINQSEGRYDHHEQNSTRFISSDGSGDTPFHQNESDAFPRKRRKGADDDPDYQPPSQRRHTPRKYPQRNKQFRTHSPGSDVVEPVKADLHFKFSEEESRLASSDLEDCEEVWIGELSEYMLETQKRQKQVENWFEASILERNSTAAQRMSHLYARRIANMPLPPPTPPLISQSQSLDDDFRTLSPLTHISNGFERGRDRSTFTARDSARRFGSSAEDAAHEFEKSVLGDNFEASTMGSKKGRGKEASKRPASGAVSDASSDLVIPSKGDKGGPAPKKRKMDTNAANLVDDFERALGGDQVASVSSKHTGSRTVGKQAHRDPSPDSLSVTPKSSRRKPGVRKKLGLAPELEHELASHPGSVAGDATPAISRPASPAPIASAIVYELDEPIPSLKKAKKVDDNAMIKRIKSLEEAQRKVWTNIARRDVAKVYKYHAMGYQSRQSHLERIAKLASIQARRPFTKTAKANKDTQAKAKRLMREMQVFWKKNEREERDLRKREQKEAQDRLKIEEEKREAARQARKLEFLISQTELYSHFVGSKLKTTEIQGDGEGIAVPAGADVGDVDPESLQDIDFDNDDPTNLHRHAKHNAQEAIALAKQRAQQFDTQAALERKTNEALKLAKGQAHIREDEERPSNSSGTPLVDLDSDELNFQNPTSLSGPLTVGQPQMLMAQLKEYQLKGLNWLATLYEQGINGILADEMGLGKTVQSISLLAYLAETHDIWGPFLVVAPASTLHNWQQEITRFVPGLKALPYWGNVKDRATLRKFWSKKEISYNQDAPFHVLITSYQLVTQDQQYFQRVKWQYMILDEAQNIKNSSSVRWKTLLGFHCRNRLLLTGTPIQNSMQELWALLHFIMPSLFDSHDEFNEWFSKDIENAAENKGSKLNEHQLRRLHMILKPFMLRRVKRHVQNELSEKIEKDIYVDLSARQRALYKALLANVSVADLLEKAANIGDVDSARSLMNLVMQFRKVCNHPELFERADVVAPFSFCNFGRSGPLMREGDFVSLSYSTKNPIELTIPELLYHDGGLLNVPYENSSSIWQGSYTSKLFTIWSTDWIHDSLYDTSSSSFSFLRLLNMSSHEAHSLHVSPLIRRKLLAIEENRTAFADAPYSLDSTFAAYSARSQIHLSFPPHLRAIDVAEGLPNVYSISSESWSESCLSRPELKWFVPAVVAPPIALHCKDRTFLESQMHFLEGPMESLALYGLPPQLRDSEDARTVYQAWMPGLAPMGLINNSPQDELPTSTMHVPEAKRLIYDSAKLSCLDGLLQELKTGDHRVLVYFQMTRMMDLMEEYLIYRQYKYLRLDGSSKLEDRRDMVIDWQTRPDIFVFLLSTRAGGLGINLTAADTVIFYDHDWNPSNDAQAMDRAHRLGQTRQVTVYRLITKGTIDERIVQLARVKKDVQDIVVGNKNFTDVTKPSEIVQLLLNDEQLATLNSSTAPDLSAKQKGKEREGAAAKADEPLRDLWNDEGDDFFGHVGPTAPSNNNPELAEDESAPANPTSVRGKKRKPGVAGTSRGRKSNGKKKSGDAEID